MRVCPKPFQTPPSVNQPSLAEDLPQLFICVQFRGSHSAEGQGREAAEQPLVKLRNDAPVRPGYSAIEFLKLNTGSMVMRVEASLLGRLV